MTSNASGEDSTPSKRVFIIWDILSILEPIIEADRSSIALIMVGLTNALSIFMFISVLVWFKVRRSVLSGDSQDPGCH
jgi:hypothetical protein